MPLRCVPGDRRPSISARPGTGDARLDELFDQHYERLVRSLTVAAGSREAARDAVQDAFVTAHLRWRRISHYDDPVGWIRRVAVHDILNGHRSLRRQVAALVRLGTPAATDESAAVELRHDLTAALRLLSPRQRMAVALHHLEGLPVAEIALLMEVAEGTVKTHLARGRQTLTAHLEATDGR